MTSDDYSYTNDLDEGGMLSAVSQRGEQNHSPLAQVVTELGGSHASYDYLEESLSAEFDDDFEDVQAALALEDFVGDDGSNLQSDLFESNSVFDIGADEPGTRTPSAASQQSVSGTDFDTLPIAPMAKRPIEAPPLLQPLPPSTTPMPSITRRTNGSSSNYGYNAANVPNLTAAMVGTIDTKGPGTPFKYLDTYGISSPSAPFNTSTTQPQHHTGPSSNNKHGRENGDHTLGAKQESGAAGSSIGPYGMGNRGFAKPSSSGTDAASRGVRSSTTAPGSSTRAGLPAPPALSYGSTAAASPRGDGEGFGFGIETFLHGNQLGFGRQPSFKRIAPGGAAPLSSNTSRPCYMLPGMQGEGSGDASLPIATDSSTTASPTVAKARPAGGAAGGDRNAEAFTTWLEALDPNSGSSARSSRGGTISNGSSTVNKPPTAAAAAAVTAVTKGGSAAAAAAGTTTGGPSIGEDFKREVDVMMKDLLGDYDLISGVTGVFAGNTSVTSGLSTPQPPPSNGGTAGNGRRSSFLGGGGGKDAVRQLDYDALLRDVRMLTPTTQSPNVASDPRKKPAAKAAKSAVSAVEPHSAPAVEGDRRPSAALTAAASARKSIPGSAPPISGGTPQPPPSQQQQQQRMPQPQTSQSMEAGGASGRRRRVWSTSMPARSSGEGISGAALDPSTEAETAEPPKPAPRRVSETAATAHKTPPPVTGPRPTAAMRVPRHTTDPSPVHSGQGTRAAAKTSPGKLPTPKTKPRHEGPLFSSSDPYEDMDEDLLAGGYLTGGPLLRSTESLSDINNRSSRTDAVEALVPTSPPKDGSRGVPTSANAHGRRISGLEGQAGTGPLLRQKLHSSLEKNATTTTTTNTVSAATAASGKPMEPVSAVKRTTATTATQARTAPNGPPQQRVPPKSSGEVTKATAPPQRRSSIPSLATARTPLSAESVAQGHPLPLPSFTPNRASTLDPPSGGAQQALYSMQRDSERKGASVMTMDSVTKASRHASTSPSTVEPIVLAERDRAGFLQRVSTRSSESRDDAEVSTSRSVSVQPQQPRRRLTEFRTAANDANGVPPSSSRSRLSVGASGEVARAEAAKQRERERETQQANEERRQRIQAFMAKRKAEKRMEEVRRGQLVERDRRLEAFREAQERQRIHDTTGPEASQQQHQQQQQQQQPVAGSGLNAIKASQRLRKPFVDRPLCPSVPTASFIPTASTVPMSPEQSQHAASAFGAAADTTGTVSGARRRRNQSPASSAAAAAAKAKVRALVVFVSSAKGGAARNVAAEERRGVSSSSASSAAVFEGTAVVMGMSKSDHAVKVLQPQERPRYFTVEEYLEINGGAAGGLTRSVDKGSGAGVGGSHNTSSALRTATTTAVTAAAPPRRRLMSLTLTEMSRKFLAGVNVALLLGSTEHAQEAAVLAIREVVEGVVSHLTAQAQLFVSVAAVAGGNTRDLLVEPPRTVRSTFGSSPLFGPTLDDVTYVPVTGVGHLLHTIADAYKRVRVSAAAPPEAGLLVTSLLLKQWRDGDVILSSYLITDAGCDSGLYTAVLRKSQHAPFALFHAALGGPTLTTVLMAAASEDVTTVVPLLNVQHRLATVMNKPCHVGSVRRFLELAQRELDSAEGPASNKGAATPSAVGAAAGATKEQSSGHNHHSASNRRRTGSANSLSNTVRSNSNSKLSTAARQQMAPSSRTTLHKRLAEQVAMAEQILADPEGYQPRASAASGPTDSDVSGSATVQTIPHTAPPSAANAPRTQLTKSQEAEMTSLNLSPAQRRTSTTTTTTTTGNSAVPVPAASAAAVVSAVGRPKAEAAGQASRSPRMSSPTGMALPTILPVSHGFAGKGPVRKETTAAPARAPPAVSAVPLRHPEAVPTEPPTSLPPGRRSSNYTAAAAGRDGHGTTPSLRTSRDGGVVSGSGICGFAAAPFRQSAMNEQSVSASTEYVRRGRVNADDAAQRKTGFMNFEDVTASQVMPSAGGQRGGAAHSPQPQQPPAPRSRYASKASDQSELPQRPVTTAVAATVDTGRDALQESVGAARRRVSADGGRPSSGLQSFAPPSLLGGPTNAAQKKLLPGATTIGSNGPQWPSTPAFEIPTIQSVASIDTSFTHDVSLSMRQSSNGYEGERAPIPTSTKVRTLVVVDARCRETSNVTYDNTMVIATTEDDFEEYDVDEVREATPGQKELIQAELLKELCDTLLMGCNAAILGADSRPTGFSAQALKSVVHTIYAEMQREGTHRSGRLSASIVKVKGESVVDLLKDGGEAQKLVIAISPLFGSCVHGVTYADVASGAAFDDVIDAALRRATAGDNSRDYGFLFCSLLLKLRLEEEGDVQVCSLVTTFAGENVGLYTSVLDRSPLVPRALFHYALGGPSYTIALLGIGSEETRANQMLQVQKRLGEMSNRATHPGSVAKFVAGIRNDLTPNLIAKYEHSRDPSERAATKEMIERLAEMVKDADALLVDFDHHQPKAYLHGDAEQQQGPPPPPPSQQQQQQGSSPTPQQVLPTPQQQQLRRNPASGKASHFLAPGSTPLTAPPPSASGSSSDEASLSTPHVPTGPAWPGASAAPRALPNIIAVNPESEGERIQSLVCFEQVMMGAGTVAVQGNTILCASQGGTRFDSDEVITCDENHRSLSSRLMDELVAKFLAGHHTGLLAADSSYSAFTPLMLRHIANSILEAVLGSSGNGPGEDNGFAFTKPPTISGELQVSIALIKDDVTADLLPIDVDATYHRFEMEHTPLYGPRVVGVTPHLVATPQDFDHFLAVAIDNADPALQTADPGIMVVSLVLTQRVTKPVEDVLVSSLLCTAVFDAVHHYERVLEGSPSEPTDLFKSILRGPCFSVALLGISDEEEDPGKLLRALNDLSQVRNRAPPVNSVLRHIRELQRGIVKLKERMTTSSNGDERAYIQSRVEVAEKLLEEAESMQRNPLSLMQPRAFVPLGGTPDMR